MKKEYIYQAEILNAETDEVIIRIQGGSQDGLEEEMGKSKWTGAIERYEAESAPEDIDNSREPSEEDWHALDQDDEKFDKENEI